ncbi:MAG: hypothetical protein GY754_18815 [bacterium]|nr:hypothetical protein [bacterium]MCP4133025.1 hypothetical protein [bacterium]
MLIRKVKKTGLGTYVKYYIIIYLLIIPQAIWAIPGPEVLVPMVTSAFWFLALLFSSLRRILLRSLYSKKTIVKVFLYTAVSLLIYNSIDNELSETIITLVLIYAFRNRQLFFSGFILIIQFILMLIFGILPSMQAIILALSITVFLLALVILGRNLKKTYRTLLIAIPILGLFIYDASKSGPNTGMPAIELFPVNNLSMIKTTIPDPDSLIPELKEECIVIYFGEEGNFLECHPAEGYLLRPSNFHKKIPALNKLRADGRKLLFLATEETIKKNKLQAIPFLENSGIPIIAYTIKFIGNISEHPSKNLRYNTTGSSLWRKLSIRTPDYLSYGFKKPVVIREQDAVAIKASRGSNPPFAVTVSSFLEMDDDEIKTFARTHKEKGVFLYLDRSKFSDVLSSTALLERFHGNLIAVVLARLGRAADSPGTFLTINRLILIIIISLILSFFIEIAARFLQNYTRLRYIIGRISQFHAIAGNILFMILPLVPAFITVLYIQQFAVPVSLAFLATPLVYTSNLFMWPLFFTALFFGFFMRGKEFFSPYREIYFLSFSLMAIPITLQFLSGEFPFLYILITAPLILFPVLFMYLFHAIRCYIRRKKAGTAPGWASLQEIAGLEKAGLKAARLGTISRKIKEVPPGIVVWVTTKDPAHPRIIKHIRKKFNSIPLILRSTAPGEDSEKNTAAGKYVSTIVTPDSYNTIPEYEQGIASALYSVVSSYPREYEFSPVLCMPLIKANRSGVAVTQISATGITMIEESSGTDYVTSGIGVPGRLYINPVSKKIYRDNKEQYMPDATVLALTETIGELSPNASVYVEWAARGKKWWIVQMRPIADSSLINENARNWTVQVKKLLGEKKYTMVAFFFPDLQLLEPLFSENVPSPAGPETLQFWAKQWQRDSSLGHAVALFGIPRFLIPSRVVLPLQGELFALIPAFRYLALLIGLSIKIRSTISRQPAQKIAENIARKILTGLNKTKNFGTLTAASIALRFLQHYLPANENISPPSSVTLKLSNAVFLFNKTNNTESLLPEFACNGPYDLDPACPRYMEILPNGSPAPDLAYIKLPEQLPDLPEILSQSWCAFYRDVVHSHLCFEITRTRFSEKKWMHTTNHTGWLPPRGILTVNAIEMMGIPVSPDQLHSGGSEKGTWVSGAGPVEGIVTLKISGKKHPKNILVIDHPRPELSAYFSNYLAVVSETGGMLSHSAIVARENNIDALFGVPGITKKVHEGDTIIITEDGDVRQ